LARYSLLPAFVLSLAAIAPASAQQPGGGQQPVVIQRRLIRLTPPDAYQFGISLSASRELTIRAPFNGTVRTVSVQAGKKVLPQTEVVALESKRLELSHKRATAALEVAEGLLRVARSGGKPEQVQLGEAQVALAEAEFALSTYDKAQSSLRAPYEATVLKVHVQQGQEIKAGDPLVTIGDLTSLQCTVPVDRKVAKAGQTITLTIEDAAVVGLVESIEPVSVDQQRLRDLAVSVAMAVVSVRNADGKLARGQAVYPNIVPNDPVTRVPLKSISTTTGGRRVVQVLREHVVRNVPIVLHGQIGKGDAFVSGPFTENDQVIISASIELADSTAVQQSRARASSSNSAGTGQPATSTKSKKASAAGF
jgi:biotin carboxyl carrier protein